MNSIQHMACVQKSRRCSNSAILLSTMISQHNEIMLFYLLKKKTTSNALIMICESFGCSIKKKKTLIQRMTFFSENCEFCSNSVFVVNVSLVDLIANNLSIICKIALLIFCTRILVPEKRETFVRIEIITIQVE